jgi:hypothetical protein
MRRAAVLLILPLVLVAACGDDGDRVSSEGGSSTTSSTSTSVDPSTTSTTPAGGGSPTTKPAATPPAGAGGAVAVDITQGGGFAPQGTDFRSVPTIVLADGRVFTGGATTMQYPGPPLAPVSTGTVGGGAVADLVQAAKAAQLDREVDFGSPGVADATSTTIRVSIDGKLRTTSVYALDVDGPGLSAAQQAARKRVADFVAHVGDVVGAAATSSLQPTGYEVLGFPFDASQAGEDQPAPNHLDWPFADLALDPSACARITGDRVPAFVKLLQQATQITVWHAGGATYRLSIRATLPGRTACP